ncbi:MAG: hypothetical protein AAFN74_02840 [Myxococcota bacterium]
MQRRVLLRQLAITPVVTSGCGYLLYPERRGRTGGDVDKGVLVIDLLWLIPGLVPGIVCLIVDYTTGCIYKRRGATVQTASVQNSGTAEVQLEDQPVATAVIEEGKSVELDWRASVPSEVLKAQGVLRVRNARGEVAEASLASLL